MGMFDGSPTPTMNQPNMGMQQPNQMPTYDEMMAERQGRAKATGIMKMTHDMPPSREQYAQMMSSPNYGEIQPQGGTTPNNMGSLASLANQQPNYSNMSPSVFNNNPQNTMMGPRPNVVPLGGTGYLFRNKMDHAVDTTSPQQDPNTGMQQPQPTGMMSLGDQFPKTPTMPFNTPGTSTQPNFTNPLTSNPYQGSTNPFVQATQATSAGNLQGAQTATSANRVNQNTAYGGLNYQQTGTDAQGNPMYSANQTIGQPFQGTFSNLASNLQQSSQTPLDTGMPSWDKATALINERLQPQMQRENEAQDVQLANQGIMPGSQAYITAKQLMGQKQNDLTTQAQLAGLQAQNQFFQQGVTASNLPYNQLNAFRTGTNPNYVNPYNQATVAGPDYATAYNQQNQTDIANQNVAQNQRNAMLLGLTGLGSSAIAGGTGTGSVLNGLTNLGGSVYNGLNNYFGGVSTGTYNPAFGGAPDFGSFVGSSPNGIDFSNLGFDPFSGVF